MRRLPRMPGHGSAGAPCAQRKQRDGAPLALLGWEAQRRSLPVYPAQGNVTAVQRIPDPAAMLAVGWPRRNAARHRRHHDVRSWREQSNLPGRRRPGRSRLGGRGVLGGRRRCIGSGRLAVAWRARSLPASAAKESPCSSAHASARGFAAPTCRHRPRSHAGRPRAAWIARLARCVPCPRWRSNATGPEWRDERLRPNRRRHHDMS